MVVLAGTKHLLFTSLNTNVGSKLVMVSVVLVGSIDLQKISKIA